MRIVSLIVYVLTILAAYGGRVNPDYLTLPALLCLAFPYFSILTIILTVFWGCFRKFIFCALGVVTILICLNPLSEVFPLGSRREIINQENTFKIISWNVLHAQDIRQSNPSSNRALEYIINSNADVVCLAELKDFSTGEIPNLTPELRDSLFAAYPYQAGINSTFLKVLSKYPVERMEKGSYNSSLYSGFDFFKIKFPENHELIVGMVHLYSYGLSPEERMVVTEINSVETAKTSVEELKGSIRQKLRTAFRQRALEAEKLREVINEIPKDKPLIICGDFNDVPTSWTYNIIRADDLRDAYVETNFGPTITYNLHAFYFHIDQMLYRGALEAVDLNVGKINSSDHYPLIGEFEFK